MTASYAWAADSGGDRGDTWALYYRTDGTDPDLDTDTPVLVAMASPLNTPRELLTWVSDALAGGTTLKVLVRVRRSADDAESANTALLTLTTAAALAFGADPGNPPDALGGDRFRQDS